MLINNIKGKILSCVYCESQETIEGDKSEDMERAGWENDGDGPVCPDCICVEMQKFAEQKELPIYAFEKTDQFTSPTAHILAAILDSCLTQNVAEDTLDTTATVDGDESF